MRKQIHGGDIYRHKDVIDFSTNLNPLGTPQSVIEAVEEAAKEICHYPDVKQEALIAALSEYEGVNKERLITGNGAAELIFALVLALRPRKALLMAPTFAEYELALESVGCEIVYMTLKEENGFKLTDIQEYLDQIVDGIDLVAVCNPNNPTGTLLSREECEQIAAKCKASKSVLLLDECFNDFIDDPLEYTMKPLLDRYPNVFLLKAFTKRYAMPGVRLGYAICCDEALLKKTGGCLQPWNVSVPAARAGVAALKETEYLKKGRSLVKEQRKVLIEGLTAIGLRVFASKANYIFFFSEPRLFDYCLELGILLRDCGNYRGLKPGYFRVAVKQKEENELLLQTIRAYYNGRVEESI